MTDRFEQHTVYPDQTGNLVQLACIEGVAHDVACYRIIARADFGLDYVRCNGVKLTETEARAAGAGWPAHLVYRR